MINLQKFCEIGGIRTWLAQPFGLGEFTCAACAAILVRVPRAEYPAEELMGDVRDKTDKILALFDAKLPDMASLPAIPPGPHYRKCGSCCGKGEIHFCLMCQGEGWLPHYQEDSEDTYPYCLHCGGAGTLPTGPNPVECEDCEGEGLREVTTYARFGSRVFNLRYLRLIKELPNSRLALTGEGDAAHFVFDGGRGILMACREDGEVLDLTPEQANP